MKNMWGGQAAWGGGVECTVKTSEFARVGNGTSLKVIEYGEGCSFFGGGGR